MEPALRPGLYPGSTPAAWRVTLGGEDITCPRRDRRTQRAKAALEAEASERERTRLDGTVYLDGV